MWPLNVIKSFPLTFFDACLFPATLNTSLLEHRSLTESHTMVFPFLLVFFPGRMCLYEVPVCIQYSLATKAMRRMVMLHKCQPSTWNLPFFTLPDPTGVSVAAIPSCMYVARPPFGCEAYPGSDNDQSLCTHTSLDFLMAASSIWPHFPEAFPGEWALESAALQTFLTVGPPRCCPTTAVSWGHRARLLRFGSDQRPQTRSKVDVLELRSDWPQRSSFQGMLKQPQWAAGNHRS